MAQTPKKIDDFEVVVDKFRLFHRNCVGPKKFERYLGIRLQHNHSKEYETGDVDVFLTKYQALDLIKELSNMIATNDLLHPDEKV